MFRQFVAQGADTGDNYSIINVSSGEIRDKNAAKHHVGRFGDPEHDAGEAAAYLVSDRSSFVTGTTMFVDGGMCL